MFSKDQDQSFYSLKFPELLLEFSFLFILLPLPSPAFLENLCLSFLPVLWPSEGLFSSSAEFLSFLRPQGISSFSFRQVSSFYELSFSHTLESLIPLNFSTFFCLFCLPIFSDTPYSLFFSYMIYFLCLTQYFIFSQLIAELPSSGNMCSSFFSHLSFSAPVSSFALISSFLLCRFIYCSLFLVLPLLSCICFAIPLFLPFFYFFFPFFSYPSFGLSPHVFDKVPLQTTLE